METSGTKEDGGKVQQGMLRNEYRIIVKGHVNISGSAGCFLVLSRQDS